MTSTRLLNLSWWRNSKWNKNMHKLSIKLKKEKKDDDDDDRWKAGWMAHATVLPSNCWGNRVDWAQPIQSPHLNNLLATTDPMVSPMPRGGRGNRKEEKRRSWWWWWLMMTIIIMKSALYLVILVSRFFIIFTGSFRKNRKNRIEVQYERHNHIRWQMAII